MLQVVLLKFALQCGDYDCFSVGPRGVLVANLLYTLTYYVFNEVRLLPYQHLS